MIIQDSFYRIKISYLFAEIFKISNVHILLNALLKLKVCFNFIPFVKTTLWPTNVFCIVSQGRLG